MKVLTPQERQAIETAFFSEMTYAEVASTIESTPRNREDTNPLRIGSTPTGAHRSIEGPDEFRIEPPRSGPPGIGVPVRLAGPSLERASPRGGAYLRVCGLPAGTGDASPGHRRLRLLANRCAATIGIAMGTPCAANRGGDGRGAGVSAPRRLAEPEWEEAAPGISCKLLATDTEKHRVSMLVRLAPGAEYPPHRHAGVEELYLLAWRADDRRQETLSWGLQPGGAWHRRSACLERDRLHVRSPHLDPRRSSLSVLRGRTASLPCGSGRRGRV